jgi:RND superfamily putative drug exporter
VTTIKSHENVGMSTYLYRMGRWAFLRRRYVVGFWVVVAIGMVALSVVAGGKTVDDYTVPGQSKEAAQLLKEKLPAYSGGQTLVVFAAKDPHRVTDGQARAAIEDSVRNLMGSRQVTIVANPFQTKAISPDGRVALAPVQWKVAAGRVDDSALNGLKDAVRPAINAGLQVEFGGEVYPGSRLEVSETPEIMGIVVGFIILLVTFGALVAAGLPIVTAIIGVLISLMGITALTAVTDIASPTISLALMLGLACGIDYALFILSRYRTYLLQNIEAEEAAALAVGTAGSSVVFAALTVIVALCGLAVVGVSFLTVMGLCAAAAVLIALLVAITLLPALLGFAGDKVTNFLTPILHPDRPERVALIAATEPHRTMGAAWARFVVRFRIPLLILGIAVMAVIALPASQMTLGLPSGKDRPAGNTAHKAYDLVERSFGPGFNAPLALVVDTSNVTSKATGKAGDPRQTVGAIAATLQRDPGVAAVSPGPSGNGVAVLQVIPKTGPDASATSDLVHRIRDNRDIENSSPTRILVGGLTAQNMDTSHRLANALPVFFVVVAGLALILLTIAFRAVAVPITSIIGFMLSVLAAFGAQVAVFQWGWLADLLKVTPGQTVSFLPIIVLAVIFGLSSDYEVFVVSRIKEVFTKTNDAVGAVERGTGLSARVVTAAALVMFFVFVAFISTTDPVVKAIAFSLAVGVFLDAFVVRLTLVPAIMAVIGNKFWFRSKWFDRYVPDLDIEGEQLEQRHAV